MGFFNLNESSVTRGITATSDPALNEPLCLKCPLNGVGCLTPKMEPTGDFKKQAMVIAEAPGAEEDKRGIQLIGKAGQYLREVLYDINYDLDRDFIKLNAVNCRPPKNRTPVNKEIQCCRPMVLGSIYKHKPKVILLLGAVALKSVLGTEWTKDVSTFGSWSGFVIPSRKFNAWISPIYHPSFVLRERDKNPVMDKLFKDQLEYALSYLDKPLPKFKNEQECSKSLLTNDEVYTELRKLLTIADDKKIAFAFDYETSGLKPHANHHHIYTISFSYDFDQAYAFWYDESDKKMARLWRKVLKHNNILKIAHNMKYEDRWTYHRLGFNINPWYWDTMLVAHILDNRSNIVSLKKQAYLHLGVVGYDEDVKKYLTADTSNALNSIDTAPKQKILLYNAIDSLVTFRLFCYQYLMIYGNERNSISNLKLRPFKPYILDRRI